MTTTMENRSTYVSYREAVDTRQSSLRPVFTGEEALRQYRMLEPETSPLYVAERFGQNSNILVKDETDGPSGSFKLRGAYLAAKASRLLYGDCPLVTFSAGNHGRSLAYASQTLQLPLTVFTPSTAPLSKRDGITAHGAELDSSSNNLEEAKHQAMLFAAQKGAVFIDPFNDEQVIAGQGTLATEIYEQLGADFDYKRLVVVLPVGGGGLAAGVSKELHRLTNGQARVVGVQVGNADSAYRSFQALPAAQTISTSEYTMVVQHEPQQTRREDLKRFSRTAPEPLVDGLNVQMVGSRTFSYMAQYMHAMIRIPAHRLGARYAERADRNQELAVQLGYPPEAVAIAEPAGIAAEAAAQSVALQMGLMRDSTVIAVRTGINYSETAIAKLIDEYDMHRHHEHAALIGKTVCWKAPFQRAAA